MPENVYPRYFNTPNQKAIIDKLCAPAATSHEKMSTEERAGLGITDSLLRLSVGIEDVDDIIADIDQALQLNI